MFQKGSLIIYGNNGVCKIEDIKAMEGTGDRLYYFLNIFITGGTAYIPVDSPVFMREIMSKSGVEELISKIPKIKVDDFLNMTSREAQKAYHEAMATHSLEKIISVIKHITDVAKKKKLVKKKLSSTEERFLEQALKIVASEFSIVLDITIDDARSLILSSINQEIPT